MADVVNTAPQLKSEIQDRINQTSPNAQGIGDLGTIIITPISKDQVQGGDAIFDPLYNNFQKDPTLDIPGVKIGDSRDILFGDTDPGFTNNVEIKSAPTLTSLDRVGTVQDPFTNPNPPVIASNAGKIHNITNIAQRQQANQSGVTIGDSSNIRNIDFLTGQPTNNNVINSVAGVDDSTQGNNSFLRFGERIDGEFDPSAQPIRGNTGDFLRGQTASGNGLFDDSTAAGTGGDDPFDKFRNGEVGMNDGDVSSGTGADRVFNRAEKTTDTTAPELGADWRFRIGLLPGSQDLYKSGNAGILYPLIATNGVIFPYTPSIQMTYYADYQSTTPTHSNFPSRFYASSEVRDVQVNGTFTAQSTAEADYMMAAIHFFRSATKMFYGQDSNRGQTPPLLQVTGLGPHQFNGHKCVLQQFNYTLPEDVDYVRTSSGGVTTKSVNQVRGRRDSGADQFGIFGIAGRIGRLLGIGANQGAMPNTLTQRAATSSLAKAGASYVPTKMEFSLTLLPVVSRQEQTANYSTLGYANGENYKNRGHW